MAKATTISINNFLKTTIHPRLQDGVFWLVFIKCWALKTKFLAKMERKIKNLELKKFLFLPL